MELYQEFKWRHFVTVYATPPYLERGLDFLDFQMESGLRILFSLYLFGWFLGGEP